MVNVLLTVCIRSLHLLNNRHELLEWTDVRWQHIKFLCVITVSYLIFKYIYKTASLVFNKQKKAISHLAGEKIARKYRHEIQVFKLKKIAIAYSQPALTSTSIYLISVYDKATRKNDKRMHIMVF